MPTEPTQAHLSHGDSATIARGHRLYCAKNTRPLGQFIMVYIYALRKASSRIKEAVPTLIHLMSLVERENQLFFRTAKVAEDMGTTIQRVNRHLKLIKAAGLLEPDPKDLRPHQVMLWRICPFLSWKSKGDKLRDYLDKLPHDHVWFEYQEPEDGPDTDFDIE